MTFAWLSFFDALLAITMISVGIIGAHFYLIAPFMGFQLFALGFLMSILGFVIGLLAIYLTRTPQLRNGRNRAVIGHGGLRGDRSADDHYRCWAVRSIRPSTTSRPISTIRPSSFSRRSCSMSRTAT